MVARSESSSRPLGITLLCVLYVLMLPVVIYVSGNLILMLPEVIAQEGLSGLITVISLGILAISVYPVVYGLWTLKSWGWKLTLILFGIDVPVSLILGDIGRMVISLVFVGYVYSKRDIYMG